jgi:SAM-dependent methyltransferase
VTDPRRPGAGEGAETEEFSQRWDPERYARNARFVSDLGAPLLDLLKPRPGERILDLGCGDGALSEKIAAAHATVLAIDASPEQVAAARARGLDAHVGDGAALTFDTEFDAVFSNAALHWMTAPDAVIDGVWRALKPGGRFIGEFGGAGNVARIKAALIAALDRRGLDGKAAVPWFFPTPEDYTARLSRRGFEVSSMDLIDRPTPIPGPLGDWLETFAEPFLTRVPAAERPAMVGGVEAAVAPDLRDDEGRWSVDYVRLRFAARKAG